MCPAARQANCLCTFLPGVYRDAHHGSQQDRGIADDRATLTLRFWIAMQRIRRMVVLAAGKAIIVGHVAAIWQRARAVLKSRLKSSKNDQRTC
jgi:hypothetical protein